MKNFPHNLVDFIRRFVEAVRHVCSGGQTTRRTAVRRANRPPERCETCRQPVRQSDDWRDHIH